MGGFDFGVGGKPDFWIQDGKQTISRIHIAFRSENREQVRAFDEMPGLMLEAFAALADFVPDDPANGCATDSPERALMA